MTQYEVENPNQRRAVILERESSVAKPRYRVVAKTQCVNCQQWCWLGFQTFKFIDSGEGMPICAECSTGLLRPQDLIGVIHDDH